jgi:hypothetical protein
MIESLKAVRPTSSWRNQQGWPRLVSLPSMMSSATRKKACRNSTVQPRSAASRSRAAGLPGRSREKVTGTEMPRFSLPSTML